MTPFSASSAGLRQTSAAFIAFCTLGSAMLLLVAAGPWIIRTHGFGVFIPAVTSSGLITIAASALASRVDERVGLVVVLGFAAAMRLLLVGEEPFFSTDLYRYIWDGRVQATGINPYLYVPADPALAALRDAAIYPNINRADYAVTAYPPVAEMFFFIATRISESTTGMRLAMVACEIGIVAIVIDLLGRLDLPRTTVVAYAWHPLAIWEIANNGHAETLMVALLMLGVWLLVRTRRIAGAIAIALSALVKPYAVFVFPAFWRPWDWRVPLAIVATLVVCYAPYLGAGRGVLGFLSGYVAEEGLTSGSGFWLVSLAQTALGPVPGLVPAYMIAAAAIMIVLGLRYGFDPAYKPREKITSVIVLLTAGLALLSPNYAWYFLALVPFIPLGAGWTAWALTLGAFMLYTPIFLGNGNNLIWKSLATIPFLVALCVLLIRSTRGPRKAVPA